MDSRVIGVVVAVVSVFLGGLYIFWGPSYSNKKKNKKGSHQPVGLYNLGNTCFMNAVLQALAALPAFVRWVESEHWGKKPLGQELTIFLKVLSYGSSSENVLSASPVMMALRQHGWVITSEQQDAHEFFQALSSTLDEEKRELPSVLSLGNISTVEESSADNHIFMNRIQASFDTLKQVLNLKELTLKVPPQPNTSKLHIPFRGLFASQLVCKQCKTKFPVKFDGYDSISLSLPQYFQTSLTLEQLLWKFVCCEVVDAVECKSCTTSVQAPQSKSKFIKRLTLGKLPSCLCVHVQRTYWHNNGIPYKNSVFVKFPETLDMKPFTYNKMSYGKSRTLGGGIERLSQPGTKTVEETLGTVSRMRDNGYVDGQRLPCAISRSSFNDFRSLYKLMAVIVHHGDVDDGHYVTYRRFSPHRGNTEKSTWLYISDELVESVSIGQVMSCSAYMLLYEKSGCVK